MSQNNKINVDEVANWLEQFVDGFNFLLPGIDQCLGRDMINAVAFGIADRSSAHQAADTTPWEDNSDDPSGKGYKSQKAKDYGVFDEPNFRTGQMLSLASLKGRPLIEEKSILMQYGTGDPPTTSAAPTGYLSVEDKKISDIEKAIYAHTSDTNRPARPFYELDDTIRQNVIDVCADSMAQYINDANNNGGGP